MHQPIERGTMKTITKEEAIEFCRKSFMKSAIKTIQQWDPRYITDEPPAGCYMAQEHYETGCWFMVPSSHGYCPPHVGVGPIVGISKKTGEIVFSGVVGE